MQTKGVRRYRPGQLPAHLKEAQDEDQKEEKDKEPTSSTGSSRRDKQPGRVVEDRRLRRAEEHRKKGGEGRRPVVAEIISTGGETKEEEEEEEEDERVKIKQITADRLDFKVKEEQSEPESTKDAMEEDKELDEEEEARAERRRLLKEKMKREEEEQEEMGKGEDEEETTGEKKKEEEGDEEGSSEWETDTSDEEEDDYMSRRPRITPIFVTKAARETIKEKEQLEKEEQEKVQRDEQKRLERKQESLQILVQSITSELKKEEDEKNQMPLNQNDDEVLLESESDGDEEAEYEKWKIRELKRIKRDQEEKAAFELEQAETLKRRHVKLARLIQQLTDFEFNSGRCRMPKSSKSMRRSLWRRKSRNGTSCRSTIILVCFIRTWRMQCFIEITLSLPSKIRSISPSCPRSCRSRTLVDPVVPSGRILLMKIPPQATRRMAR